MKLYLTIFCCCFLCANAKSQSLEIVNSKEAFEIINTRNIVNTIIIDGRSDAMFAEKHIAGAINIDAFSDSVNTELKKHLETKEIIVYCTNQRRAELLIEKLNELQYNGKIIYLIDGLNTWISLGYETVSD